VLADAALVQDLLRRRPTLKYLVGHHEYVDKTRPHYRLYKELDPKYKPTEKSDPGAAFMKDLRAEPAARGIRLQD
jgi:N-acetylmuramoyl-L-alanine amidase